MTLAEFYDRCAAFDWFYDYSDDHRVWQRGCAAHDVLRAESARDPAKREIYQAWRRHMFGGPEWGTQKAPCPERPTAENSDVALR
jgi:hypothetical protein